MGSRKWRFLSGILVVVLVVLVFGTVAVWATATKTTTPPVIDGVVAAGEWDVAQVEFDTGPRPCEPPNPGGWDLSGAKGRFLWDDTNVYGLIEAYPNTCGPGANPNGPFDQMNWEVYINAKGWPAAVFLDTTQPNNNHPGSTVVFSADRMVIEFSVPIATIVDNTGGNLPSPYTFNPSGGDFLEYRLRTTDPDSAGGFDTHDQTLGWVIEPPMSPSGGGWRKLDFSPPPAEVWVDDNWVGCTPGDPVDGHTCGYDAFGTIQEGIDAVAGSTVHVAAGTYNENLIIDKDNLILQGADKTTTIIVVTALYGVQITADNVTFDGFTVKPDPSALGTVQKALAIMNGATGCTVSNSIFDGTGSTKSGSMGILVRDSNNTIDDVESFGWYGYGIDVYSGGAPYADNVLIKNSNFHDNGWYNVAVDRSTNVTVQNCTLSGGGTSIAFFEKSAAPVTGGKVLNNTISGATYDGVRLVGSNVLVDGNEIYGCSTTTDPASPPQNYAAIRVTTNKWPYYAANGNTVTNNDIHDNLGNGILIDYGANPEPTGNVFHWNNIVNNAVMGFDASTLTSTVDAENNWWGDASGPSGVGPGTGDAVSANVDYDPWTGAEVESAESDDNLTYGEIVTNTDAGVSVENTGAGSTGVTVASYTSNPGGDTAFGVDGENYFDVYVEDPSSLTQLTITICPAGEGHTLFFWDGTSWVATTPQSLVGGCIEFVASATSTPTLAQLGETAMAVGTEGDVNNDGKVDVIDARICYQAGLGLISLTTNQQKICDVDNDGDVDKDDAVKIAKYSIGIIGSLASMPTGAAMAGLLFPFVFLGIGLTGLVRRRWWRMFSKGKILLTVLLLAGMAFLLSSCGGAPGPALPTGPFLKIIHTSISADGTGVIRIAAYNFSGGGVAAMESTGGFTFNPQVAAVTGFTGENGFEVLASSIDNVNGKASFAIVNPTGGVTDGEILAINIEQVGSGNFALKLNKNKLLLGDTDNRKITTYSVVDGQ